MTKLLQKETFKTVCPHCGQEINEVWICELDSIIGTRYAYLCSNCEKLLGIANDKQNLCSIFGRDIGINPDLTNESLS
jgi:hypothetical protein